MFTRLLSNAGVGRESFYRIATTGVAAMLGDTQNYILCTIFANNSGARLKFAVVRNLKNNTQLCKVIRMQDGAELYSVLNLNDISKFFAFSRELGLGFKSYNGSKPYIFEWLLTNYARGGLLTVHTFKLASSPAIAFDPAKILTWAGQLP